MAHKIYTFYYNCRKSKTVYKNTYESNDIITKIYNNANYNYSVTSC